MHLKAREARIEWSPEQLSQRRHLLAQNSRLTLLVERQQFPNLATRALGLCCRRLSADWLEMHGHPIVAVESFVDSQLMFRGTAALKAQSLPPRLAPYEQAAQPRPLSGKPLLSLLDRLPAVREPRSTHGRRHPWPAILGIVCLAKLAGVAGSQRDIAGFAKRLNQTQRRQLSC